MKKYVKAALWLLLVGFTMAGLAGFDAAQIIQNFLPLPFAIIYSLACAFTGWKFLGNGAEKAVDESILLSQRLGMVGIVPLLIALGTAVSEFSFTIVALQKGQPNIVFSAITESDMFNIAVVFGASVLLAKTTKFEVGKLGFPVYLTVAMTAVIASVGLLGYNPLLASFIVAQIQSSSA